VLGAAGDVVPGFEAAGGEDAGGSEAGGAEDAGGDDAGGGEAGGEDAGGDDAGADEAGGDDAGADEAGGEDAGADDAGDEDFAGLPGSEDVDGCTENWDTIGVGARDVLEALDRVGLKNIFGETRAAADGADEDDGPGEAAGLDETAAGEVATAPAPACGCRWLAAGVWGLAPIRAKAATAEPATRPPVRHADASGREIRCRPGPPVPRRRR
jgi:hypothetical protein